MMRFVGCLIMVLALVAATMGQGAGGGGGSSDIQQLQALRALAQASGRGTGGGLDFMTLALLQGGGKCYLSRKKFCVCFLHQFYCF
ncbi:hypothetical protein DPMN_130923 [Dreissena polymorpha]|uniref:Uncharacterized protein n=1 Tax=Dreissena polymorpha TaxID=45954 RepID=A0A9D4H3P9_DREPO|nr:hypothetical protein DPMN_130923 [Dreissena polymorpha]